MKPSVSFSYFSKLDIRVGSVESAKEIAGTNLMLIKMNLGEEGSRQLVAGINKDYQVKEIKGKQLLVVINLEPKEVRGVKSEGMLLAADAQGEVVLVSTLKEVRDGTIIR